MGDEPIYDLKQASRDGRAGLPVMLIVQKTLRLKVKGLLNYLPRAPRVRAVFFSGQILKRHAVLLLAKIFMPFILPLLEDLAGVLMSH